MRHVIGVIVLRSLILVSILVIKLIDNSKKKETSPKRLLKRIEGLFKADHILVINSKVMPILASSDGAGRPVALTVIVIVMS